MDRSSRVQRQTIRDAANAASPRRIGFVIPSLAAGGSEQAVTVASLCLDRSRYIPLVYCMAATGKFSITLKKAGIPVRLLAGGRLLKLARKLTRPRRASLQLSSNPVRGISHRGILGEVVMLAVELVSAAHLAIRLHRDRVAVVSVHYGIARSGLLAARIARIPAVYVEEGVPNNTTYRRDEIMILRRLLPLARRIIVHAELVRPVVVACFGIAEKHIDVVRHAPLFPVRPTPRTPRSGTFVVAALGRLAPAKGHRVLLEAIAEMRARGFDCVCRIAGDGPERAALERETVSLGLEGIVEFTGQYDNEDVPRLLEDADVLAVPSFSESFGIVALEGMACGLPIVASAVGGLPEVVRDGRTGILVPPGDVLAFTDALAQLVFDPSLRHTLGENGRQLAFEDTPEQVACRLAAVFDVACAEVGS